jgi:hypothetical protein
LILVKDRPAEAADEHLVPYFVRFVVRFKGLLSH